MMDGGCFWLTLLLLLWSGRSLIQRLDSPETTSSLFILLASVPKITIGEVGLPPEESFALDKGGEISVDIEFLQPFEANNTFFMILTSAQIERYRSVQYRVLYSLSDPSGFVPNSNFLTFSRQIVRRKIQIRRKVEWLDRYTIVLMNSDKEKLKYTAKTTLMNPGMQHLSYEQIPLLSVLAILAVTYIISSTALFLLLLTIWKHRLVAIHWLLLATMLTKALYLLSYHANLYTLATHGAIELYRDVMPKILGQVQDIMALMLYLVVALGWKILRTHLTMTEVRFSSGICVVLFYLGIFQVSCTGPRCSGYELARYILHALGFLCIFVAINFNIAMLNSGIQEAELSLGTAELYRKYDAYRIYRWVFISYIMKPTALMLFKLSLLDRNDLEDWIFLLAQEITEFAIYAAIGYAFRPFEPLRVLKDLIGNEEEEEEQDSEQ